MSFIFTTSAAAIAKAGKNANSTIVMSGVTMNNWSDQAVSQINAMTRRNWVTTSASTTTYFKEILNDLESDIVAMKIINYDMSGYTGKREAETMLDFLRDNINRNIECLKDDKNKEVML